MSGDIIQLNPEAFQTELKSLVKNSIEETLNAMLDEEAKKLVNAERYAREEERNGYRAGHYDRKFTTTAGEVNLRMPKLKGVTFETAIIERYKRRETSIEEALIEMYLAGVSVRRGEDITEALWGTKVSPGTISNLNKKAYEHIEAWRNRPLKEDYPFGNVKYQRCIVHFYRNVFTVVPNSKVKEVTKMLKAIHAQEDKAAALEKAKAVEAKLRKMKLFKAAQKIADSVAETLTYMDFPAEHWTRIRTNNVLERINREIKRRTKVVGTFPDGESALMLVCARLRHITSSVWGTKRYLNMEHLRSMEREQEIAGAI